MVLKISEISSRIENTKDDVKKRWNKEKRKQIKSSSQKNKIKGALVAGKKTWEKKVEADDKEKVNNIFEKFSQKFNFQKWIDSGR